MTLEFIHVVIVAVFGMLALGFYMREIVLISLSGMLMMVIGIYSLMDGISGINNFLSQSFSVIIIGIGAYVLLRGAVEKILEVYG